ncbi:MAG: septum formation initiator family protein [Flavobacteriales bacterium]|nr:septum formation initiator family protein [Flavobacteriales bacterium]
MATLALLLILTFFEDTNLFRLYKYKSQLNEIMESNQQKEDEIVLIKQKTTELTTNPEALETFARETYIMKKEDETVFLFVGKSKVKED